MNIVNRALTLNRIVANQTVECIAGCRVELDAFEIAGLTIPGNPGFRLRCVLEGVDVGPDAVIYTYPRSRTFTSPQDLLNVDHVFTEVVSQDILNEDVNDSDEIRAVFTLVNLSTGQSRIRRSPRVDIVL